MTLLIFLGIALATALLGFDTVNNLKAMLKPIPVRAQNRR
ncbi:hypothetical protein GCM10027346_19760 [Hymenobacter seoulensis]